MLMQGMLGKIAIVYNSEDEDRAILELLQNGYISQEELDEWREAGIKLGEPLPDNQWVAIIASTTRFQ
jgi:hypothetical protein